MGSWISFNTVGALLSIFAFISALIFLNPITLVKSGVSSVVGMYSVVVVNSYRDQVAGQGENMAAV